MDDTSATHATTGNTAGDNSSENGNLENWKVDKIRDLKSSVLVSVLNLEELDVNLYRATHSWEKPPFRLYGGEIIGQALVAAAKSVGDDFHVHSLHCSFVRPGDPKVAVLYQVDHIRDGQSFMMRSVRAIQHEQPILFCQVSFHKLQPSPLQHQFIMPVVPPPEDLLSTDQVIHLRLRNPDVSEEVKESLKNYLANELPIEVKPIDLKAFYKNPVSEPRQLIWVRAHGHIGEVNMKLHCSIAAYISDYWFLETSLLSLANRKVKFSASLDHTMWFHNTFCSDEWMLYECESPWAANSRALVQGRMWRRDGVLAFSSAQEGTVRVQLLKDSSKL